jgi:hypothetical protein
MMTSDTFNYMDLRSMNLIWSLVLIGHLCLSGIYRMVILIIEDSKKTCSTIKVDYVLYIHPSSRLST